LGWGRRAGSVGGRSVGGTNKAQLVDNKAYFCGLLAVRALGAFKANKMCVCLCLTKNTKPILAKAHFLRVTCRTRRARSIESRRQLAALDVAGNIFSETTLPWLSGRFGGSLGGRGLFSMRSRHVSPCDSAPATSCLSDERLQSPRCRLGWSGLRRHTCPYWSGLVWRFEIAR